MARRTASMRFSGHFSARVASMVRSMTRCSRTTPPRMSRKNDASAGSNCTPSTSRPIQNASNSASASMTPVPLTSI
jgi:hypothetical protein